MLGNKENGIMGTIFNVMKEEYERLTEAEHVYRKNIAKMPKGSLRKKHLRHKDYLYLARRDGSKVVYDYVGNAQSDKAKEVTELVNKRKRFEALLKEIKETLKDVKKVLRGKI
jgi:hypothetical protein